MTQAMKWIPRGCAGGWKKPFNHPVLGPEYGTTFDMQVLKEDGKYKMWFSWRPVLLIAYAESENGIDWTMPKVVFHPDPKSCWESQEVSRPSIVKKDGIYHMWYTGHVPYPGEAPYGYSSIGYATSSDGLNWTRYPKPVLWPEQMWEKNALMCPDVHWDEERNVYRMWYSGGPANDEPDAIGYAESEDGIHWTRYANNPILLPKNENYWEMKKVTAGHLLVRDDWHYMFYIGFDGDGRPSSCLARSKDGITGWERHPDNPVLAASDGFWDNDGICRVSVVEEEDGYNLWYNGVIGAYEMVGYARHDGLNLGFDDIPKRKQSNYQGIINHR